MARPRPPLPPGPWLVVGLARSGVAAALALRARGEEVRGVDRGQPPGAAVLRDAGVEVELGTDGLAALHGAHAVVKSPGVPREAPVIAAARERGIPVLGELELGWRLVPNELDRGDGHERQDDDGRAARPHPPRGGPARGRGRQRRHAAGLAGGRARARRRDRLRGVVVPARGHARVRARGRRAAEPRARPPRPPRHARGLPRRQAAGLRAAGQRRRRRRAARPGHRGPGRLRAPRVLRRRRRRRAGRPRRAAVVGRRAAARASASSACAARTTAPTRWPRRPSRSRAASTPTRCAPACATFAGVEHRLEEVATRDGVLYVNDSKATNVDSTLVALASFDGAGAPDPRRAGQGPGLHAAARAGRARAAAVYLIGEDAEPIAAALEGTVALRRCGDLERAVAAARAAAAPGEVVLLSPACASFDQYADFEARGRHFKALARG